jgi:ubiquinone/menaquinone biosynthesis C-methylase UbiE
MTSQRKRVGAMMLHRAKVFPRSGDRCLEIGFGSVGWLGDLISWGIKETDLFGIELDPDRAQRAQELLPMADLRVGDGTELPWQSNFFQLIVVSTVFTSILDQKVRVMVANEIMRVLAPRGALLWYDFAVNNPRNPHVRKVSRNELRELFPKLKGRVAKVTLAPPIARLVAPRSWALATLLEAIPVLRTHALGVLVKTSWLR